MSNEIGELLEEPGEVSGHWRIPNFLSLPEEVDKAYLSPKFFFSDSCWCLAVYPNGESRHETVGWIGLYLLRLNCDLPKTIYLKFGVRNAEGKVETLRGGDIQTTKETQGHGWNKYLEKSILLSKKTKLAPSDALTITYTLKSKSEHPSEGSFFKRLWNISCSLKTILCANKRTDVRLNLKDGTIAAHKIILESQSAVFKSMFGVDMLESETGEVKIEDATADAFRVVLFYSYSGDPRGLNPDNVTEVYKVAHKYEFEDLRKLCTRFMQETLSHDTVCDVIALADLYQEMTLKESAKDYFAKNKTEIFKTDKWKTLKSDNPIIGFEVLESITGGDA